MKIQRATPHFVLASAIFVTALLFAQSTKPSGQLELAATTANVAGAPDNVRIEILRWSTDDEREKLMSAWELKTVAPTKGGAGKGGGKGGGKGAAKGGAPVPLSEANPEANLATAIQEATTVGYLWSSEVSGYALRYAGKVANPDGSQRIVLITERRMAANQAWKPSFEGSPSTSEFSVIELRLNAKGEGEGKVSLVGKITPDPALKIVSLENYDSLPVVLRNVRTQARKP